jgi:large subunit ribosomal protein L34e
MPRGMFKSRTFRRVATKLPGGSTTTRYLRRKPNPAHCARCGTQLHGIPRGNPADIAKLSKTQKRPERMYGGVLCSRCLKDTIKVDARQ